jgi:hypothetical protein
MLTPVFPKFRRRPAEAKGTRKAPAPPVLHRIVSVSHGGDDQECGVTVSQPIAAANLPLIQVSFDGVTWISPIDITYVDETTLELWFDDDVGNFWRVTQPTDWEFADGANLDAPYSGSFL